MCLCEFPGLLSYFLKNAVDARPIETDVGGPALRPVRVGQGGQSRGHALHQRRSLSLLALEHLPARGDFFRRVRFSVTEDMRVATDELVDEALNHIGNSKRSLF